MTLHEKRRRKFALRICRFCEKKFRPGSGVAKTCKTCLKERPICQCGCGIRVTAIGKTGGNIKRFVDGHVVRTKEAIAKASVSLRKTWKSLSNEERNTWSQNISKAQIKRFLVPEQRKKISDHMAFVAANPKLYPRYATFRKDVSYKKKISRSLRASWASGCRKTTSSCFPWESGILKTIKAGEVNYKSSWEKNLILLLEEDDNVTQIKYEPFILKYRFKNKVLSYFPDFLVEVDGRHILVELKGWIKDPEKEKRKLSAAKKFCKKNNFEFLYITKPVIDLEALYA